MVEIMTSRGTEAISEKARKCRKRRRKGLSGRGPNLVETTHNSTTSVHLCEELIIEIFTRLPAKSLLRFRSLSKSLCSCIDSPSFIRMHTSRSPQKILIRHDVYSKRTNKNFYTLHSEDRLGLCCRRGYNGIKGYKGIKAVKFPYGRNCECAGSCNGIFCLFDHEEYGIILWNPSIRRKIIAPSCPARFGPTDLPRVNIGNVYDPIGLGFGYDTITDDYKIVSLPLYGDIGASSYVYTMKTDAWCEISSPAPLFFEASSRGCFVNGALHWVVQRDSTRSVGIFSFYILTFNLSTHVFGEIVLPKPNWKTKQLTTIQGSLATISTKNGDSWIWVMKEYNNTTSWYVFFKSKSNKVKGKLERVFQPTINGELFFNTSSYDEGFRVYDPKRRTKLRLHNLKADYSYIFKADYSSIIDMETCVESLQLLQKGTSCRGRLLSSYYSSRKFVK